MMNEFQQKMDKLERRTQRAIVELLRERLEKEAREGGGGGDDDSDLDWDEQLEHPIIEIWNLQNVMDKAGIIGIAFNS